MKNDYYIRRMLRVMVHGNIVLTSKLAQEIGLSEKSARNKITAMDEFLREHELGRIEKKPHVGIWLHTTHEQLNQIHSLLSQREEISVSYDSMERETEVLKRFFRMQPRETLPTQRLADELYISVPTVLKVIRKCEDWLKQYPIQIVNERNHGFRLQYEESEYRIALKDFIMRKSDLDEVKKNMYFFFANMDMNLIKKCIIEIENEWNYRFTDDSFYEILIYCCLAYQRRDYAYHPYYDHEEMLIIQHYNEYPFTVAIFKKLHEKMHVIFSNEDVLFLAMQIMCSKFIDITGHHESLGVVKQYDNKLVDFVNQLLDMISNILDVDLRCDEKLRTSLIFHLRSTIFRIRYGTPQGNNLMPFIKEEYKHVLRATWVISILFEEYYGLHITEDELGYIVLYIESAIERITHPYQVVLLSDSSMGHVQLLCEKIRKIIPEVKDVAIESTHDFRIGEYADADVIITSHDLNIHDKRIIQIENLLSEEGISKLHAYITKLNVKIREDRNPFTPICFPLFSPDIIFIHPDILDKANLLSVMAERMEAKGFVSSAFYESVMEREQATTTSIGNGVSLPHGAQSEVNESKVAIAILKEPILWEDEFVDVVFLLGFKMTTPDEIERIQTFYKQYISLVETDEKIKKLKGMKSDAQLYKYLIQ